MDETDILTEAMRAEKSIKLYTRISAVRYVLLGHPASNAATYADVTQRTVQLWVERFRADGVDGLRDLPGRRGHPECDPAKVAKHALVLSRKNALTPKSPTYALPAYSNRGRSIPRNKAKNAGGYCQPRVPVDSRVPVRECASWVASCHDGNGFDFSPSRAHYQPVCNLIQSDPGNKTCHALLAS